MLRDLHANTRSKRSAAIRRRGAVSPASVCSQSSLDMPITSRFSPCRQMISEVRTRASCTCAEITARSSASSAINLSWAVAIMSNFSITDALDRCPARRQLLLQPLKAAVEMIDAVDHGFALGGEAGNDQGYRGA